MRPVPPPHAQSSAVLTLLNPPASDQTINITGTLRITADGFYLSQDDNEEPRSFTSYQGDYRLSGSTNFRVHFDNYTGTIVLRDFHCERSAAYSGSAMDLSNRSNVTFQLEGSNYLIGGFESSGLLVPEYNSITIKGDGLLDASYKTGGNAAYCAAIGGPYNGNFGTINIEGGTIYAHGSSSDHPCLGSGNRYGDYSSTELTGNIYIHGGIVHADLIGNPYGYSGAALSITGGIVNCPTVNVTSSTQENCILNNTVIGNCTLNRDYEIPSGQTLVIPSGTSLTILEGVTLTNNGTITNNGVLINNGTLSGNGSITGDGSISHTHRYTNGICQIVPCDERYEPATLSDNQYQITNAGNLFWFANYVNSENASANAIVTQDISMPDNEVWRGIGNATEYNGTFDGNGKTISGLNGEEGLVKNLSGTVQNVILKDVNISRDLGNLGCIAGVNTGSIINCYTSGTIKGKDTGFADAQRAWSVGGIVGHNYSTSSSGGVEGYSQGGLIKGCISECTVTGATAGGLVGSNSVGGGNDDDSTAQGKMANCLYIGELKPEGDNVWGYKTQVFRKKDTEYKVINGYKSETKWSDSNGIDVYNVMIAYSVFQEAASQIATPAASVTTENTTVYHETVEDAFSNANGKTAVIQILETTAATGTLAVNGEDTHITLNIPEGKTLTANIEVEQGTLTVIGSLNGTIIMKNGSVTVKREDGSSTTTTEKTQDGVTTRTVVEKDKDGHTISSTQTVTQPDGSAVKTELPADGSKVVTTYDKDGEVTEKRTYPDKDKPAYILDGYKPRMIEDGGTFNGGVLVFRSDDEFCNFRQVTVNGEELSTDSYTAESGSIRVTLKVDYLNSLPSGSYTVGIVSTNGTAQGSFVIPQTSQSTPTPTPAATSAPTPSARPSATPSATQAPASSNTPPATPVRTSIPATGDSIPDTAALFLLSGAALTVMALRQRRQKNK